MLPIPPHVTRIFLLAANGLFVSLGLVMICFGIYQSVRSPGVAVEDDDRPSGAVIISAGCLDLIIGVCGLAGAVLNKRILLLANAAILTVSIIGNLVLLIVFSVALSQVQATAKANIMQSIVKQFGNNSVSEFREFTDGIQEHQREDACCGWSGINGPNLFIQTPWFREFNGNTSFPHTLPDSCCVKITKECQKATNVKEARDKGFVHKSDCIDKMIGRNSVTIGVIIAQLTFVTVMQIVCVGFSVLHLLQEPVTA